MSCSSLRATGPRAYEGRGRAGRRLAEARVPASSVSPPSWTEASVNRSRSHRQHSATGDSMHNEGLDRLLVSQATGVSEIEAETPVAGRVSGDSAGSFSPLLLPRGRSGTIEQRAGFEQTRAVSSPATPTAAQLGGSGSHGHRARPLARPAMTELSASGAKAQRESKARRPPDSCKGRPRARAMRSSASGLPRESGDRGPLCCIYAKAEGSEQPPRLLQRARTNVLIASARLLNPPGVAEVRAVRNRTSREVSSQSGAPHARSSHASALLLDLECPRFRGHLRAFVERRRPGGEKCLGPDRRTHRSFVGRRSSSFASRASRSIRSRRVLGSRM